MKDCLRVDWDLDWTGTYLNSVMLILCYKPFAVISVNFKPCECMFLKK